MENKARQLLTLIRAFQSGVIDKLTYIAGRGILGDRYELRKLEKILYEEGLLK